MARIQDVHGKVGDLPPCCGYLGSARFSCFTRAQTRFCLPFPLCSLMVVGGHRLGCDLLFVSTSLWQCHPSGVISMCKRPVNRGQEGLAHSWSRRAFWSFSRPAFPGPSVQALTLWDLGMSSNSQFPENRASFWSWLQLGF